MPTTTQKPKDSMQVSHTFYTAIKRLVHTVIMSIGLVLCIGIFVFIQQYNQLWVKNHTFEPRNSISKQYAEIIAKSVKDENREALESILRIATDDPAIIGMAVFDIKGKYLAPLPRVSSIATLTKSLSLPPTTHVNNIYSDGEHIGYLHTYIDTATLIAKPNGLRKKQFVLLGLFITLALIIGIYLTRGFYKFRPWIKSKTGQ